MAQDYAKKRQSSNRSTKRKSGGSASQAEFSRASGLSWFFSGLFTGLFIAFIAFLALDRPAPPSASSSSAPEQAATEEDDGRGTFDFYQYLPEAAVQVDVVPVEIRERASDGDQRYLLQAGSFQDKEDAEGRRANILLENLDARVVPGIVAGKTWHRVQVGPFEGRQAAEEARETLSANNIDTIVMRVRQEDSE